eukprot:1096888-Amphidinium_carterae.1
MLQRAVAGPATLLGSRIIQPCNKTFHQKKFQSSFHHLDCWNCLVRFRFTYAAALMLCSSTPSHEDQFRMGLQTACSPAIYDTSHMQ